MFKIIASFIISKFNRSFRVGLINLAIDEHSKLSKRDGAHTFESVNILHLNRLKTALIGTTQILLILIAIFLLIPTLIYVSINYSLFIEEPLKGIDNYIDAFKLIFIVIFLYIVISFIQLLVMNPYRANNVLRREKPRNADELEKMRKVYTSIVVDPIKVFGAVDLDWESFAGVQTSGDAEVILMTNKTKSLFCNWLVIPGLTIRFSNSEDAQLFSDLARKYIAEIKHNKKIFQDKKEKELKNKNFEQERINEILYKRD